MRKTKPPFPAEELYFMTEEEYGCFAPGEGMIAVDEGGRASLTEEAENLIRAGMSPFNLPLLSFLHVYVAKDHENEDVKYTVAMKEMIQLGLLDDEGDDTLSEGFRPIDDTDLLTGAFDGEDEEQNVFGPRAIPPLPGNLANADFSLLGIAALFHAHGAAGLPATPEEKVKTGTFHPGSVSPLLGRVKPGNEESLLSVFFINGKRAGETQAMEKAISVMEAEEQRELRRVFPDVMDAGAMEDSWTYYTTGKLPQSPGEMMMQDEEVLADPAMPDIVIHADSEEEFLEQFQDVLNHSFNNASGEEAPAQEERIEYPFAFRKRVWS